jgi:hypothetical protein
MIVRGPLPTSNFTVLANEIIRDERLSYRARGILIDLLSRPGNWRVDAAYLARHGKEGRDAILTALTELEEAGYLKRTRHHDRETGRWAGTGVVYDSPMSGTSEAGFLDDGQTGDGQPGEESQASREERGRSTGSTRTWGSEEPLGSTGSSDGSALRADRAQANRAKPKRPKPKRKPLTKEERHESWLRFRSMDLDPLDDDIDIRAAAFLELEKYEGAFEPDRWAQKLIDNGNWEQYCEANDLGHNVEVEWTNDKGAA